MPVIFFAFVILPVLLAYHLFVAVLVNGVKRKYGSLDEADFVLLCHVSIDFCSVPFAIHTIIPRIVEVYRSRPELFSKSKALTVKHFQKKYSLP